MRLVAEYGKQVNYLIYINRNHIFSSLLQLNMIIMDLLTQNKIILLLKNMLEKLTPMLHSLDLISKINLNSSLITIIPRVSWKINSSNSQLKKDSHQKSPALKNMPKLLPTLWKKELKAKSFSFKDKLKLLLITLTTTELLIRSIGVMLKKTSETLPANTLVTLEKLPKELLYDLSHRLNT